MAQTATKSILKDKTDILDEKYWLLGKEFQKNVVNDTEAKTKMHNTVRTKKKGAKAQPHPLTTPKLAFQESPSRQYEYTGRGWGYSGSGGGCRTTKKWDRFNPKEKISLITSPFLNSLEFPVLIQIQIYKTYTHL